MLQSKSSCAATVSATGSADLTGSEVSATCAASDCSSTGSFVVAVVASAAVFSATGAFSCCSAFGLTILLSLMIKSRWFLFGAAKLCLKCEKSQYQRDF